MRALSTLAIAVYFLVTGPQAAALTCAEVLAGFDRTVYIRQTSTQSRYQAIAQTIFTGATVLQLGTPTMLRGIKMKGFFWVRDGHLLRGMKRAHGEGASPWGKMEIFTQSGTANTLDITVTHLAGFRVLSPEKIGLLQELFPALAVETKGDSGMKSGSGNEIVPDQVILRLRRSEMSSEESFEQSSRSLVSTLLNDPKGLLGLNPKQVIARYELPKKLRSESFLSENWDFFGNFGPFSRVFDRSWSAYNRRDKTADSSLRDTNVRVDLDSQRISFWLENASFMNEVRDNVRRIVWSLLELGYDRSTRNLPSAKVNGINGVSVEGLGFDSVSLGLVKVLDNAQNNPMFKSPLEGLSTGQQRFVNDWLLRKFNQSDLNEGQVIRLEDIVVLD